MPTFDIFGSFRFPQIVHERQSRRRNLLTLDASGKRRATVHCVAQKEAGLAELPATTSREVQATVRELRKQRAEEAAGTFRPLWTGGGYSTNSQPVFELGKQRNGRGLTSHFSEADDPVGKALVWLVTMVIEALQQQQLMNHQ